MTEQEHSYVELLGAGVRIPVPDVPPEEAQVGDAESRAVAAHPAFQRMRAEARRQRAAGETVSAAAFFAQVDAEDAAATDAPAPAGPRGRKPAHPNGQLLVRIARTVHQELAQRAVREGISVNQLVAGYINRGLGEDEGARRAS